VKSFKWWAYLLAVIVYLAIIQVGGLVIGNGIDGGETMATAGNMLRSMTIPIAISTGFAIGLATWLGWWPQILHEQLRVRKWVWLVPIAMLISAVVMVDWGNLVGQKAGLILVLLLTVVLVGFTEELMFRGVGVVTFRNGSFTEAKVALFTSLVFGAAHLSNAIGTGSTAIFQAIVVSFCGYFFYLTRRVSGAIWLPMVLHASWDFGVLSGNIGDDDSAYPLVLVGVLVLIAIGITLIIRRRKIEPEVTPT
jgi:membrane protease YdiL (CAAX protease family)